MYIWCVVFIPSQRLGSLHIWTEQIYKSYVTKGSSYSDLTLYKCTTSYVGVSLESVRGAPLPAIRDCAEALPVETFAPCAVRRTDVLDRPDYGQMLPRGHAMALLFQPISNVLNNMFESVRELHGHSECHGHGDFYRGCE